MLTYEKIKTYYDGGYWSKEQVAKAVEFGKISPSQYTEIVGEPYAV